MAVKKYINLNNLSTFLESLRNTFAEISHKHTISDLTDYTVDAALSSTSANPVQNKVIDAEFEAISTAMNALDLAIDGKAEASHNHNDMYYTESEIDTKVSNINTSITNIVNGTTKVSKATSADSAISANTANTANSATKATQDGNGKVISSTYETKTDASSKLAEAKSYTDTSVDNISEGFSTVIYQMYGDDIGENGAPTIRDIANDEATNALESAKSYTDESIQNIANNFEQVIYAMYDNGSDINEDGMVIPIRDIANDEATTALESANSYTDTKFNAHISAHAPSDAEKNQNAFSNVKVGSTTIAADVVTDTLTLVAGDNVAITPDATNDKITISMIMPTEEDALELLMEMNLINPVVADDGSIYTDENGAMYTII